MTTRMFEVLKDASKRPLRRVHHTGPGGAAWPANSSTLAALVRHGFLSRSERISRDRQRVVLWEITEEGKAALRGPELQGRERPVFPARGGGSTSDWTRAVDHDPRMGALDDMGAPSEEWLRVSRVKRLAVQDRKVRARQAARNMAA